MFEKKVILHLCADIGNDSYPYKKAGYNVVCIGKKIGIENYKKGMFLVNHCLRIIKECKNLKFYVIENPASGKIKEFLGKPDYIYEPWWFGDPWTKKTALWGKFNKPKKKYCKWENVPKNKNLYKTW